MKWNLPADQWLRALAAVTLLAWGCGSLAQGERKELPPAAHFFRHPAILDVQLSPDGERLGLLVGVEGRRVGLYVLPLADVNKPQVVALFSDRDVGSFTWVNAETLLFDLIDRSLGSGEQQYARGLFSVRANGEQQRQLVQLTNPFFRVNPGRVEETLPWNHGLLRVPDTGGSDVIIGRYEIDNIGDVTSITPLRQNVETGRTRPAIPSRPGTTLGWWFDRTGEPRVALSAAGGRDRLHIRAADAENWDLLADAPRLELPWTPAFIDGQGQLYVRRSGRAGVGELVRFNAETRKPEDKPFISTPGFEFSGSPVSDRDSGKLLGVRVETDAESTIWFDADMKALQAQVDQRLPDTVNRLSCRRCSAPDRIVLVHAFSPSEPGRWFVLRGQDPQWIDIGRARREIDPRQTAQVSFQRIRARDGRDLPVWLTVPPGRKAGSGGPAVVLVHGGPWMRGGHWQWSAMEQFLASRGYVVINAEFRGSWGYGQAHFRAGWRQWGRAMQDDVADATAWAVKEGWADAKRICIAGGSYGGYATLMGLIRHSELYRCGAAWVAVTEPDLLFRPLWRNAFSAEARRYSLPTLIGDPVKDAESLAEVSPVRQAARLERPLLLAFSSDDRLVPIEHGERLRAALRSHGRDPEYVAYAGEGHGWLLPETSIDFAGRLERFLAKHLAP